MSDLIKQPTLFSPPEVNDPDKTTQLNADLGGFYSQQRILDPMKPLTNGDLLPTLGLPPAAVNVEPIIKRATEKTLQPYSEKAKRGRMIPPLSERIMIYVRQETEDVYTPLHLVPPTVTGLITAIENKYKINACNIRYLYRKNKDGIIAKIDDDMLRHYCNEDVFLMQVMVTEGPGGEETMVYDITLSELQSAMDH
jgi:transcription factor CP2-like protein